MDEQHSSEHEGVLEALLTGERDRAEPEIEALLASCATCRARYQELEGLVARIRGAGREQREILEEATRRTGAPGQERVEEVVRGLRRPARASRPHWPLVAAAAAVVVLAFGAGLWWPSDGERVLEVPDGALGSSIEIVHPRDTVAEYGTFSWKHDLPRRGSYVLRIEDDTEEHRGEFVAGTRDLETNEWTPPTPEAGWPTAIRWTVEALDGQGVECGFGVAQARLSSR